MCCCLSYWLGVFLFPFSRLVSSSPMSCSGPEAFGPTQRKNGTLNTRNTTSAVNHAEKKQIALHNHKQSCTKALLYCVTAPLTLHYSATLALFFSHSLTHKWNANTQYEHVRCNCATCIQSLRRASKYVAAIGSQDPEQCAVLPFQYEVPPRAW